MEKSSKARERPVPTLLPSPTSHSSSSGSSGSSNGGTTTEAIHQNNQKYPPTPPPTTPKQQNQQQQQQNHVQPITRSEPSNPCPTTFVQADMSSFKQIVQMLTGSSETAKQASQSRVSGGGGGGNPDQPPKNPIPPIKTASKAKPSRLSERRNTPRNLRINPLLPGLNSNGGYSPRKAEILSPSILDFPALVLSPVTPLIPDPFNRSPMSNRTPNNNIIVDKAAEEKAIAEKGFFLHPSPVSTPGDPEPRLLPLFPATSPRVSGSYT
ncbi:hypothetical protein Ancab_033849 [Ancistrocladus abbreviatus]